MSLTTLTGRSRPALRWPRLLLLRSTCSSLATNAPAAPARSCWSRCEHTPCAHPPGAVAAQLRGQRGIWGTLIELPTDQPEWTLVGGQMVMVRAAEHAAPPLRVSRVCVPIVWSWALTRGFALHPGTSTTSGRPPTAATSQKTPWANSTPRATPLPRPNSQPATIS